MTSQLHQTSRWYSCAVHLRHGILVARHTVAIILATMLRVRLVVVAAALLLSQDPHRPSPGMLGEARTVAWVVFHPAAIATAGPLHRAGRGALAVAAVAVAEAAAAMRAKGDMSEQLRAARES